jgi:biotin carboxyl carrier protein
VTQLAYASAYSSEGALLGGCDRIVVSPVHGRVRVPRPVSFTSEGEVVRRGEVIATVDGDGATNEICAPCDAWVMDYLARDGERLEPGSAIVHLRAI